VYARSGNGVLVKANREAKLLVLSGQPIDEPIVGQGPFVLNSRTELLQAFEDFQLGRMGELPD
jgi:redox-sensitive bicupin YhaK (pirin superfamily)